MQLTDDSTRGILRFVVPLIGNALVVYSFAIVDSVMMARFGHAAFAGVSIGGLYFGFVCSFFFGALQLYTPLTIRRATSPEDRARHLWSAAAVALGAAACVALLATQTRRFFELWEQPPEVVAVATEFVDVLGWAAVPMMLGSCLQQAANIAGKPAIGLYGALVGIACNVLFNWMFIYGNLGAPELGARGCALATVLARTAMVPVTLWLLVRLVPRAERVPVWPPRRPELPFVRELLRLGVGRGLTSTSDWILTFALVLVIGQAGVAASAANAVGDIYSTTIYLLPNSFCQVMTIVVARRIADGARRGELRRAIVRLHAVLFALEAIVIAGSLVALPWILRAFSVVPGDAIHALTRDLLLVHLVFYATYTLQHTLVAVLDAFLDTRAPSVATVLVSALMIFPLAIAFSSESPAVIWAIEGAGTTLLAAYYAARILRNLRQHPA